MTKSTAAAPLKVAVIGGGLVGSLSACYFAKRGHDVTLYEYRQDIRATELVQGRSINLAMSQRARTALKELGLEEHMVQHGIPMKGRMIHKLDGSTYPVLYDANHNQCIFSVGRKHLNEYLLTAAEKYANVKTVFQHKLVSAKLQNGTMTFLRTESNDTVIKQADLIVGADGAFSNVRKELIKHPLYDYSQKYIEHGYLELCISPKNNGDFAMEPNYLHIWPRGSFMMIALPNQDKTWTVTLFMPFSQFGQINSKSKLLSFFQDYFPDAVPLIGEDRLVNDFFASSPSYLVSVKCNPYHFGNKVLLIGDAAHAMVPFYGQGMNAGFEDCLLLHQLMTKFDDKLHLVLPEFSKLRNPDAEAICDLAMYNYIEMRDLVNRKSFLLRKKLDNVMHSLFSNRWIPLYNSVTFTNIKYSDCVKNRKFQDKVVSSGVAVFMIAVLAVLAIQMYCIIKDIL